MNRTELYYNKETDTAFRIESNWGGTTRCIEVSTTYGRAKLHGHSKKWQIEPTELNEQIRQGKIFEIASAKFISRDIAFIRAGKTPPEPERKAKAGKTKRSDFKMKVGSLIDENPDDYVGIFNADGNLIGHEYNGKEFRHEAIAEELIEEVKNPNQIYLFT